VVAAAALSSADTTTTTVPAKKRRSHRVAIVVIVLIIFAFVVGELSNLWFGRSSDLFRPTVFFGGGGCSLSVFGIRKI
jgi:fatty acid desaturase